MPSDLLHYREYGAADNPPLLFLHGLFGESSNWQTQARRFEDRFHIINIDLINHGNSPHRQGMSYEQMADDVVQLIRRLGLEKVYLSGHSMGGKVAMVLALQYPELLLKLVVVDIAPVQYPQHHQQIIQAMLGIPVSGLKARRDAEAYLQGVVSSPMERGFLLKNLVRRDNGFAWQCNLADIAMSYPKISGFPDSADPYTGDTLFIRGGKSAYISEDKFETLFSIFPKARLETIAEAGHLPHVETPGPFSEILAAYLSEQG